MTEPRTASSRRAFLVGGVTCLTSAASAAALPLPAGSGAGSGHGIDPMDFGAKGDGATDDYAALKAADAAAAAAGMPLRIKGHHLIGASYALTAMLDWNGGQLRPASGVVLTVNGLTAPPVRVFDLSAAGKVIFAGARMPLYAHAEWFGALGNNGAAATANRLALNAAIAAHPAVRLLTADYFVDGRIDISVANHTLEGTNFTYDGATANQVTRLICTSATSDILLMGLPQWPGSVNALPEGIAVRHLYLNRTTSPDIASNCDGVRLQFCRSATLDHVKSVDSINSLHILGVVSSSIRDCRFARVSSGTGPGKDTYNALWIDGRHDIGAAGGVASVYVSDCSSECNNAALQAAGSTAHFLDSGAHGFQDVFIDRCESVSFATATRLTGAGGGEADVRLRSITDDQAKISALTCEGLNPTSVITIQDYYCGPSAGAQCGVLVKDCHGAITFMAGQILLSGLSGLQGIAIQNSRGIALRGTVISECTGVPVSVAASSNCVIEPEIVNNRHASAQAAIQVRGPVAASRFAPAVHGQADAFAYGIQTLDRGDDRNIYDVGGIDSTCLKGGSGQKLLRDGVRVTASGPLGTNEVRGPMG